MTEIVEIAKRKKVLRHIAEIDPALAEELAQYDSPEERIAEEVLFARLVKNEKFKQLDLETLLVALDFWKTIFDTCIKYLSTANVFFMMNFLDMYSYVAKAVEERLKLETPSAKDVLVMKALELMDELKKNMNNPFSLNMPNVTTKIEVSGNVEKERKAKRKRRRRK